MSNLQNRFVLRPLELKHLFDFAIRLLRLNFLPMFLSMAMVQLPVALLSIPMTIRFVNMAEKFQDPSFMDTSGSGMGVFDTLLVEFGDMMITMAAVVLVIALYQLLITPLGLLTCARLASRALDGFRDSFSDAFGFALSRYWPTQVALATFFLPTVGLALVVLMFVLLAQMLGNDALTIGFAVGGMTLIGCMVLATMFMYFRFFPALCGVLQATEDSPEHGFVAQGVWFLKRSFGLTQGHYLRIFMLLGLLWLAWYMVNGGLNSTLEMLWLLYDYMSSGSSNFGDYLVEQGQGQNDPMRVGIQMVVMTVVMLIFPPYWQCYKLLLYMDLRCRKEALDIYRLLDDDRTERQP